MSASLPPPDSQVVVTVTYPHKITFDLPYYLSTHMPLCHKVWSPYCLGWSVSTFDEGEGDFSVVASIFFRNQQEWETAWNLEGTDETMNDVKNYTDARPTRTVGKVVGGSARSV